MGYIVFQSYTFEGHEEEKIKSLRNSVIAKYNPDKLRESTACELGEIQSAAEVFHFNFNIDLRTYLREELTQLAKDNDAVVYFKCGSEMGGMETNDSEEKYYKWKPKLNDLYSYGFLDCKIIVEFPESMSESYDLTNEEDKSRLKDLIGYSNGYNYDICDNKFWTLRYVKGIINRLKACHATENENDSSKFYFYLANGFSADLQEKEKSLNVFEINNICKEYLTELENSISDGISVTNDKTNKYFTSDLPSVFVELDEISAENDGCYARKATSKKEMDSDELPF